MRAEYSGSGAASLILFQSMPESSSTFDIELLRQLITEKCAGTLTPAGHDELELVLAASAQARAMYQESISIHASLGWEFTGKAGCNHEVARLVFAANQANSELARPTDAASHSRARSWLPAVAGCLLFAATLIGLGRWIVGGPLVALVGGNSAIAPQVLGTLTPLVPDTQWSFGAASAHNPSSFFAGETVLLNKGAARLLLSNTSTAQLEAPV